MVGCVIHEICFKVQIFNNINPKKEQNTDFDKVQVNKNKTQQHAKD